MSLGPVFHVLHRPKRGSNKMKMRLYGDGGKLDQISNFFQLSTTTINGFLEKIVKIIYYQSELMFVCGLEWNFSSKQININCLNFLVVSNYSFSTHINKLSSTHTILLIVYLSIFHCVRIGPSFFIALSI